MDRLPPVVPKHQNAYDGVLDEKNVLLEQYILGRYAQGLEHFADLEQPNAEDCLWFAQCLLALDRPVEALQQTLHARALGLEDAGGFAVFALCVTGEVERAEQTLDSLELGRLSLLGRAVAARGRGGIALMRGQFRQAITHLEHAWEIAAQDPLGTRMLSSFSGALAWAFTKLGHDAMALQYLNRALGDALATQRPRLLYLRGFAHLYTGALSEAVSDLESLERLESEYGTQTVSSTHRLYLRGLLARARGLPGEANEHFSAAAAKAKASGEREFEFYAVLNLAAVTTSQDKANEARAHLSRARGLAQNLQQHAFLGLRHGAMLARIQDADAIRVLETTVQAFESLALEREVGVTHLHLAEIYLRSEQTLLGVTHISLAVDARHALGFGTAFAVELSELPVTLEFLQVQPKDSYLQVLLQDLRTLDNTATHLIEILTLGRYGIRMGGKMVKLECGAARTVELITFLIERNRATLGELQTGVFDGVSDARARNHIHVIRNSLAKSVPGLRVPFEPISKTYSLSHPGLHLTCDALEVKRSLASQTEFGTRQALRHYSGPCLPDAESDWANEFRRDLEWNVVSSGLRTVEDLFSRNRFEACADLAERLLELTPTNEGLAVMLVQSLRELHGVLIARARLEGLKQAFMSQVGEIPPLLLELDRQTWTTAN